MGRIDVRALAPSENSRAVAFANRQFHANFYAMEPKLYRRAEPGSTYGAFAGRELIGMLSVRCFSYRGLRIVSVGTVCTAGEHRGQGVMGALFAHLEEHVFPASDLACLLGRRSRYEHFGFAKAYPVAEYAFYPAAGPLPRVVPVARGARDEALYGLYRRFGAGVERRRESFFDLLTTNLHTVYLLSEGERTAYAVCRDRDHRIAELCGDLPVQDACRAMAERWQVEKVFYRAPFNAFDPLLLEQCDSCSLAVRGNVRILRPERVLEALASTQGEEGSLTLSVDGAAFRLVRSGATLRAEPAAEGPAEAYTGTGLVRSVFSPAEQTGPLAALVRAKLPSSVFFLDGI